MAGAAVRHVPIGPDVDFLGELKKAVQHSIPAPLAIVLNFPANPTAQTVDLDFYGEIVDFCRLHNIIVLSDLAYAEIYFDGNPPPSILEVPGARDIAVEFTSLSKTYSMAGWRIGFAVGNQRLIAALGRVKSYLDYGAFTPIQVAATAALNGPQECIAEIRERYRARRDVLVDGLRQAGWEVPPPAASMFAWAPIPAEFRGIGTLAFSKLLLERANVAVVAGRRLRRARRGLRAHRAVENRQRLRQATRNIKSFLAGRNDLAGIAPRTSAPRRSRLRARADQGTHSTTRLRRAPPYVRALAQGTGHENRQFVEDIEKARQELPRRAAQGAGFRDQQGQSPVQGAPGLSHVSPDQAEPRLDGNAAPGRRDHRPARRDRGGAPRRSSPAKASSFPSPSAAPMKSTG